MATGSGDPWSVPLGPSRSEGTRRLDVVGFGQISLDRVATVDAFPHPGGHESQLGGALDRPGGQIATAVLAARTLGCRAALGGAIGDDAEGQSALAPLRAAGVDTAGVAAVPEARTRSAWIFVRRGDGERSVLGWRDPRCAIPSDLRDRTAIADARLLLVDTDDLDLARWAVDVARQVGTATVLDVDRADPDTCRLARDCDFPIVSELFVRDLSDLLDVEKVLGELLAGASRLAIATLGPRGAVAMLPGGATRRQAAEAVSVVDTTGAGDVFRGAFAWAVLEGWGAGACLAVAGAAGAHACQGLGAQAALPTAERLRAHASAPAA
ncbi:MAG: carbohydrate kinase family protein [Myxococcota bacterium]